ncbi:unnamed protein product, partial [Didymodactylos carnosus]
SNCVADCLSRYPVEQPDDIADQQLEVMTGPMNNINMAITSSFDSTAIQRHQLNDTKIKLLYDQLKMGPPIRSFELETGVVHKIIQRRGQSKLKLSLIPTSMIPELLHAYHNNPTSGYLGVNKTWNKIRNRYYWPGMYNTIKQHVLSCTQCQQFKVSRKKSAGTLEPIEPPAGILDLIGLDFVGPVPQSTSGNKYILVCTDYLSKWAVTQATPNCTAETAAKFLVEKIILQYGTPKQLLTDKGSHLMANVFEAISSRCGINHIKTTTYHPQTNGLTERFNATLAGSIGAYVNQQQTDWDDYLPFVTFAYNTFKQATTGMEPFKLMYGRSPVLPFDIPSSITQLSTTSDYYTQLTKFLKQAKSTAKCNIEQQQNIYKQTYDTGRQDQTKLQPGQLVLLKQMMNRHLGKFFPKYYGPFKIIQQNGRLNYKVKHTNDGHEETVHVSRIRVIV